MLRVGDRVEHPKYGAGVVIATTKTKNNPAHNVAVKFDKGGPQGFAVNATNDTKDLKVIR